ncbi:hypothetical protein ACY1J9_001439 [Clostridium botulinum]
MEIRLSEIENLQNKAITKNGEIVSLERILIRLYNGNKGRIPTYYYKGKKVIVDIKKDDIERIGYCDLCMIYILLDNEDEYCCPECKNNISFCEGFKLKNKNYYLYSDKEYSLLNEECKKRKGNTVFRLIK